MHVSIIIPVFNRPAMAERAVRSAISQGEDCGTGQEIVLVDDGSMPSVGLSKQAGRIKVLRLQQNCGPAAARNAGVRAATGDYIAFLDSDDVWLGGKLARQLPLLQKFEREQPSQLHALVCSFYYAQRATGKLQALVPRSAQTVAEFASGCWFSPGSTLLISRAAFEKVGPLDERLRRLEDLEWFVRFGRLGGRLHVEPHPAVIVAPSRSAKPAHVQQAAVLIRSQFGPGGTYELAHSAWRRLRAHLALEEASACLFGGQRLRGFGHLLISVGHMPRLSAALGSFWESSDDIPPEVMAIYRQMHEH